MPPVVVRLLLDCMLPWNTDDFTSLNQVGGSERGSFAGLASDLAAIRSAKSQRVSRRSNSWESNERDLEVVRHLVSLVTS